MTVGFLPQEPQLDPTKDVRGNVEEGVAETRALLDRYDAINMKLGEEMSPDEMEKVLDEQARLQDRIDATNAWDLDSRLEMAMDSLRLPPPEADAGDAVGRRAAPGRAVPAAAAVARSAAARRADQPPRRRVGRRGWSASSRTIRARSSPSPTTATSSTTSPAGSSSSTAATASRIRATTPAGWSRSRRRLAQEEKTESKRQRTLQRELDWIRMSPRARQAKGKARLNAYEQLLAEDTSEKLDRVEIYIPPGPRLGDIVVEARGVKKAYGDNLLFDDLTFTLPRGGIVGVIGPNGAGKTTTFRMITGQEQPDAGTLRLGETVQIGYVDQNRDALEPNKSVFDVITGGEDELELGKRKVASRAYVSWFNFKGARPAAQGRPAVGRRAQPRPPGAACSARAATCCCSTSRPTTSTSTRCERSRTRCSSSPGCAVVISHDRWFLDRIATHILAFEGDSQVTWFEGNYQDYEADRKRRLGAAADQPHRLKYRKLTRT